MIEAKRIMIAIRIPSRIYWNRPETREYEVQPMTESITHNDESRRMFLENACAIMLHLDTSGNLVWVNDWTLEVFGFNREELVGHPIVGTLVPYTESTGRDLEAMFRRFYEFPMDFITNINENTKKNGERIWVAWTNRALFDSEGWINGFLSVGVEITNEQHDLLRLRNENTLLRSTLNAFDDAIFITDGNGQPKGYNKPLMELFPSTVEAFASRNVMQLLEIIAGEVRLEDREVFRQTAGTALASAGDMGPGDFVQGKIKLIHGRQGANIAWQARPRTINGVFEGLLWIFRNSG